MDWLLSLLAVVGESEECKFYVDCKGMILRKHYSFQVHVVTCPTGTDWNIEHQWQENPKTWLLLNQDQLPSGFCPSDNQISDINLLKNLLEVLNACIKNFEKFKTILIFSGIYIYVCNRLVLDTV